METARLICVAPAPKTPGSMMRISRRTSGEMRRCGQPSFSPTLRQDQASQRHCAMPAAVTAQESFWPVTGWSMSATIRNRLSRIEVAAVAAKRSTALSNPPWKEASEMNTR